MTEKLKQKVKEELKIIPKRNRDAINSLNWDKISTEIAESYLSTDSETNNLQVEILLVLIGLEPAENFNLNIERNLIISKNTANKINDEVVKKIFEPMVEKISSPNIKNNEGIKIKDNSSYQVEIYRVGKKYGLHIDQIGILEEIINRVISGELLSTKFEEELKSKLEIPSDKLFKLINDTNESIFKAIRNKLESNWEERRGINKSKTQNKNESVPVPPYKKEASETKINSVDINDIENKLNAPSKSDNVISDYSLPKMSSGEEINKDKGDIYREKI